MALGPVMVDLEGVEINNRERKLLLNPQVGGVILFSRNFASPEQLRQLISDIHTLKRPKLLVAVDHEGGRVQRFHEGFSRIPAMARFGELFDRDPKQALSLAEGCGWLLASELRAEGVDVSFTPVLDLGRGISGVIGDRAFHRDPEVVGKLAVALISGMKRAGMVAVGKHFPGHGSVKEDSHVAKPVDDRPLVDILAEDMRPFERLIAAGLAAVMPAHVLYPQVDSHSAGFSAVWLQRLLRGELRFEGVIFSDDLSMAGASIYGDYPQRAAAALQAGCDMVLVCNHPEGAEAVVASLHHYSDPAGQARLARLHGRQNIDPHKLRASDEWQLFSRQIEALNDSPWLEMDV